MPIWQRQRLFRAVLLVFAAFAIVALTVVVQRANRDGAFPTNGPRVRELRGRILGSGDNALPVAHVVAEPIGATPLNILAERPRVVRAEAPVGKDGSFRLLLPDAQDYKIWFLAPWHAAELALLFGEIEAAPDVEVRLKPDTKPASILDVQVLNVEKPGSRFPMQPNGSSWTSVEKLGPVARYTLRIKTKLNSVVIPNPSGNALHFMDGRFISVHEPIEPEVVTFNPDDLPAGHPDDASRVFFVESAGTHGLVSQMVAQYRTGMREALEKMRAAPREKRMRITIPGCDDTFPSLFRDPETPKLARHFAGALALSCGAALSNDDKREILTEVLPESPVWAGVNVAEVLESVSTLGPSAFDSQATAFAELGRDRYLRARATLASAQRAEREGVIELARRRARDLSRTFEDIPEVAQYLRTKERHSGARPGEALPGFSFEAIGGKRVANVSYDGRSWLFIVSAHGCPPCERLSDELREMKKAGDLASLGLLVAETGAGTAEQWDGLEADVVLLDDESPALEAFGVWRFPTIHLVGPEGRVLATAHALSDPALTRSMITASRGRQR